MIEKDGNSYRLLVCGPAARCSLSVKYEDDFVKLTRSMGTGTRKVESYVLYVKGGRKASVSDMRVLVPVKSPCEDSRVLFSDSPNKVYLIETPSGTGIKTYVFGKAEINLTY